MLRSLITRLFAELPEIQAQRREDCSPTNSFLVVDRAEEPGFVEFSGCAFRAEFNGRPLSHFSRKHRRFRFQRTCAPNESSNRQDLLLYVRRMLTAVPDMVNSAEFGRLA